MASFNTDRTDDEQKFAQKVLEETPEKLESVQAELQEAICAKGDDKADWAPQSSLEVGLASREAFLRWAKYNPEKARVRRATYWARRTELFQQQPCEEWVNDEKLAIALRLGVIQVPLGARDLEGRQLLVARMGHLDYTHVGPIDICKAFWYMFHIVYEKEFEENNASSETPAQFKGVSLIQNLANVDRSKFRRETAQLVIGTVQDNLPIRMSGIRILNQPWFFTAIWSILSIFIGAKLKSRMTFLGSDETKLREYASVENIPTDCGGALEWDHLAWLKTRGVDIDDKKAEES